jgi:hypothetical protein
MQIEHGRYGVIGFVMTTRAFGIPFEEQVGWRLGHIGGKSRACHQRHPQGTPARAQQQHAFDIF